MFILLAWVLACGLLWIFLKGGWSIYRGVSSNPRNPLRAWIGASLVSGSATFGTYAVGALAGWGGMGMEACHDTYDAEFNESHTNRAIFPLHNMCNAEYDLVPSWVNPAVVVLAGVAAICIAFTMLIAAKRLTTSWVLRRQIEKEESEK